MKSAIGFMALFLIQFSISAQDTQKHDPLIGPFGEYPIFANSAEIVTLTDTLISGERHPVNRILDINSGGSLLLSNSYIPPSSVMHGSMWSDCASADFDGDTKDEILTAWVASDGMIHIEIIDAARSKPSYTWQITQDKSYVSGYTNSPLRIIPVNLDSTAKKEFLICRSFEEITVAVPCSFNGQTFTEGISLPVMSRAPTDLAAGDFNGDGFDDIINVFHSIEGSNHNMTVEWYAYSFSEKKFKTMQSSSPWVAAASWTPWKHMKVITGDFKNTGHDEAVIALTNASGNNSNLFYNYIHFNGDYPEFSSPPGIAPSGSAYTYGYESEIVSADLNPAKMDGDELIAAGPGEVAILKFSGTTPYYLAKTNFINSAVLVNYERRHFLAVEDLDADTSSNEWVKEIIVAEHKADSTTYYRVLNPVLSSNEIINISDKLSFQYPGKSGRSWICAGNFDFDAIGLSAPTLLTSSPVYQPIVELNVPPTHFDVLNDSIFDICKLYTPSPSLFSVEYKETNSQTSHFTSEVKQDWGVAGELSASGNVFGAKVKAYVKGSYDKGYYGVHSQDTTITTSQSLLSAGDDWILATVTTYDFWEYPLYAMGKCFSHVLVQVPHSNGTFWMERQNLNALNWIPPHEVGNIFSYVRSADMHTLAGSRYLTDFSGITISQSSGSFYLKLYEKNIHDTLLTTRIGAEVGVSISGWGIEAKVAGHYGREEITTHTNTATRQVDITATVGSTNNRFDKTGYVVTPFVYWGDNGALTIDYAVDPNSSSGVDTILYTFWDKNYKANPDPAFILPWRLNTYKGLPNPGDLKYFNRSLHYSPMVPSAGDTVHVTAKINNYSLKALTSPVNVRFYLGNPSSGGTLISSLTGMTDFSTGSISSQGSKIIGMDFVVPSGLTTSARIYAVIDPENVLSEIHEDNNIGFIPFTVEGAIVGTEKEHPDAISFLLEQNYPNPFNSFSKIIYSVPVNSMVTLKIYNSLGEEVRRIINEEKNPGTYEILVNAGDLPSGVYFYQLKAGTLLQTKKMILLK